VTRGFEGLLIMFCAPRPACRLALIAPALRTSHRVLHAATNASLGGKLFANHSFFVERTAHLLANRTDGTVFYYVVSSGPATAKSVCDGRTGELVPNGAIRIESLRSGLTKARVGGGLDGRSGSCGTLRSCVGAAVG
jgi:hypothetical protein